jgi:4,5-DOPA dioxygenase extradiol
LAISAHYEREDICVTSNDTLKTIHDFYGFPRQLYNKKYDCPGSKELVIKIKDLIEDVNFDSKWELTMEYGVYYAKYILMLTFPQLK